jgi:transcriptional regulator with XRE-family HTH domain
VRSAELEQRIRSKEGTARRRRGACLPHLKAIRRSRYLTQERLSTLSGVSRESIYRLEGGRRGAMPDTLWKLALTLGVSPEDLIYTRPWWWRLSPRGASIGGNLELERALISLRVKDSSLESKRMACYHPRNRYSPKVWPFVRLQRAM